MASSVRFDASQLQGATNQSSATLGGAGISTGAQSSSAIKSKAGNNKQAPTQATHALRYTAKVETPSPKQADSYFAALKTTSSVAVVSQNVGHSTPGKKSKEKFTHALVDNPNLVYSAEKQQIDQASEIFTNSEDELEEGDPLTCGDSDFEPAEQSISTPYSHYPHTQFEFENEPSNSMAYTLEQKLESEGHDQDKYMGTGIGQQYFVDNQQRSQNNNQEERLITKPTTLAKLRQQDLLRPDREGMSPIQDQSLHENLLAQQNMREYYQKQFPDQKRTSKPVANSNYSIPGEATRTALRADQGVPQGYAKNRGQVSKLDSPEKFNVPEQTAQKDKNPVNQQKPFTPTRPENSTIRRFARGVYQSKQQRNTTHTITKSKASDSSQSEESRLNANHEQQRSDYQRGDSQFTWASEDDEGEFLFNSDRGYNQQEYQQFGNQFKSSSQQYFGSTNGKKDNQQDSVDYQGNVWNQKNAARELNSMRKQQQQLELNQYEAIEMQQLNSADKYDQLEVGAAGNVIKGQIRGHPSSLYKSTGVGYSPDKQQQHLRIYEETHYQSESSSRLAGLQTESFEMRREIDPYQNANELSRKSIEQKLAQSKANEVGKSAMVYPAKEMPKDMQREKTQTSQVTAKDKKKKKKDQSATSHLLLQGTLGQFMDHRSFFRNQEIDPHPSSNDGSVQALKKWFESLSVQDRVNSLTTTYPAIVRSFMNAYRSIQKSGPLCLFCLKKEKQTEEMTMINRRKGNSQVEPDLCIFEAINTRDDYSGYTPYRKGTMIRENLSSLFKATRITSNKQENDTLTINSDIVKSPQTFFDIMQHVTDDQAFSEPIFYCLGKGNTGRPIIESPKWINKASHQYLAVWIAAILEETLWAHFNFSNQVNIAAGIRKGGVGDLFELRSANLQSQDDLAQRWSDLGDKGQTKIIEQLQVYAKSKTPEHFSEILEEQDRRLLMYQTHQQQQSGQFSQEEMYPMSYAKQPASVAYYEFSQTQPRQHAIGQILDIFRQDPESSISRHCVEDRDLKDIIDSKTYFDPLTWIKFLQELPLQEVNKREYIRRHHLQRYLNLLIQENLRQSIQDALMNELMNSESKEKADGEEGAHDKKRKKKNKNGGGVDVKKQKYQQNQQQQQNNQQPKGKKKGELNVFSDSEDVLTADGTGASSNGASTTIVTSDDNTQSQNQPPAQSKQQPPQQHQQENEKKSKTQTKQKRKYQQSQAQVIEPVIRKFVTETLIDEVFVQILRKEEELQKEIELAKAIEVFNASQAEKQQEEQMDKEAAQQEADLSKELDNQTKSRRRKRNQGKKQDAEEIMNIFLRKLHGNYDEEDVKPRKAQPAITTSNPQSSQNGQKKGKPQTVQAQTQQAHQQYSQNTRDKMKDSKQNDKRKPQIQQQQQKATPSDYKQSRKNSEKRQPSQFTVEETPQPRSSEPEEPEVQLKETQITEKPIPVQPATPVSQFKIEVNLKDYIKFDTDQIKDFKIDVFDQNPLIQQQEDIKYDERVRKLDYIEQPVQEKEAPETLSLLEIVQTQIAWPAIDKLNSIMSTTSHSFTPSETPAQSQSQSFQPQQQQQQQFEPQPNFLISPSTQQKHFYQQEFYPQPQTLDQQQQNQQTNTGNVRRINSGGFYDTPQHQQDGSQYQANLLSDYHQHQPQHYQQQHGSYKKHQTPFRQNQYQSNSPPHYYQRQTHQNLIKQQSSEGGNSYESNESSNNRKNFNNAGSTFQGPPRHPRNSPTGQEQNEFRKPTKNDSDTAISLHAPSFNPNGSQPQISQYRPEWSHDNMQQQMDGTNYDQNQDYSAYGNIPPEQDPLFQMYEDSFYQKFDRDIEAQAIAVQKAIDRFSDERDYIVMKIQEFANNAFPGSKPVIKIFGSLMTGLALETSDMDMAVTGLAIGDRASMIDDMHSLAEQMEKWNLITDFKAIETASIPVIKAQVSFRGIAKEMGKEPVETKEEQFLPIDITFDDSPQDGSIPTVNQSPMMPNLGFDFGQGIGGIPSPLQSLIGGDLGFGFGQDPFMSFGNQEYGGLPQQKCHLGLASCSLLKEYVQTYPCLKQVSVLLKRFLAVNDLNSAYQGGISSYSAVLLIVAYMNNFKLQMSPNLTSSRLLMGFLDFYSNCFEPKFYGVNTANGMSFYPLPQVSQQMFVIVDPINPTNNTARNSFRTPDVLSAFRAAFRSLKSLISKQYQQAKAQNLGTVLAVATSTGTNTIKGGQKSKIDQSTSSFVAQSQKLEAAGDGLRKKKDAQSSQGPAATRTQEQQHLQQPGTSGHSGVTGASLSLALTSEISNANIFDSIDFVEDFLSSEILSGAAEEQADGMAARSGFGAF